MTREGTAPGGAGADRDGPAQQRRAELAANLARVRARIADACTAAGRDRREVTLVAVTKTYPVSDVLHLARLGVTDIGENRDQEAAAKAAALAAAAAEQGATGAADPAVRWHFVGRLQRNKCRSVVRYADLVHSVDSARLAHALADAVQRHRDRPLEVLVQVSIDSDPTRGGAAAGAALDQVVAAVTGRDALRLRGVMAVAPPRWPARAAFERLAEIARQVRADHPEATVLSAGMSEDLEPAIACGATHVRIGSAVLGKRPQPG